jgi:hypothetical protein
VDENFDGPAAVAADLVRLGVDLIDAAALEARLH